MHQRPSPPWWCGSHSQKLLTPGQQMRATGEQHGEKARSLGKVGGTPSLGRGWCYDHRLPVTGYGCTLLMRRLLYGNTSDFTLRAPLCLLLTTFQFPYCFRRALSPYMVQEMLMADGSASEVLRTHVQHRGHSRLISSTSTVLQAQERCLKSSSTLYCTLYHTQCHIHHSSI
jgi:hypothetical protein